LEQVHVRGIFRRGPRLELVAGLVIALALPALALAATGVATTTTLTAGTLSGCTQPLTIAVAASGTPVTSGTVAITDELNGNSVQLASAALTSAGTVTSSVALGAGSHSLTASFAGNASDQGSTSAPVLVSVTTECEFTVAVSNLTPASTSANTLTLTAGQSGTATITVTPSVEFTSTLTAPMFVTISCSGLPDGASCIATPENLEILAATPESCPSGSAASACPPTSSMVIETWAFLLPGALGLGGLGWGARHRRWLRRLSLMALVGLVTLLGTTACNPRYSYLNHGPEPNPATPAGTYTVTVNAQSNNGVTAVTHSTTFVLVVN
jgi:hypothetical protein